MIKDLGIVCERMGCVDLSEEFVVDYNTRETRYVCIACLGSFKIDWRHDEGPECGIIHINFPEIAFKQRGR